MTEVWSCGGGTQSVAIAALIIQGKLPKPDWSVIVDTNREKSSTWEYANAVLIPELAKVGVELHVVSKKKYATVDIYSTNDENILLPVFTNQSGATGKLTNFCSGEWKKRVRTRFLRENGVTDECAWIGFSVDEASRYLRMMNGEEFRKGKLRFPLLFDVPMRRHNCIKVVEDMGWPTPPRSACWMCPNQGDAEWRDLKENWPQDFQKAVELEEMVRERDPHAFFHGSCVPLSQVDFTEREGLFTERPCTSGLCFV